MVGPSSFEVWIGSKKRVVDQRRETANNALFDEEHSLFVLCPDAGTRPIVQLFFLENSQLNQEFHSTEV